MVEIVLKGVDAEDWVTDTLRSQEVSFRLLACRPADRGRRRLVRLFEVQSEGGRMGSILRELRVRLPPRDVAATHLGPDRALLRVAVPMPAICSAAFEMGDFCINCPFIDALEGKESSSWNVLVPQIVHARRLLSASTRPGSPRPSLVRAGAYRSRWGLTRRQERALRTAFDLGYFDYPRQATLSLVASRLGVGRSTALELLRKATSKIAAERYLERSPVNHPR